MAMSTACIPVPSEVVLLFGGALASETFAATALDGGAQPLNLVLGDRRGDDRDVDRRRGWRTASARRAAAPLVDRAGRYLLFRPDEVDKAHVWFDRHGDSAVLFARIMPVVRAFISLPAGVARMSPWRFTLYTLIGALTWDVGFTVAGYYLGESWRTVEKYIQPISMIIAVLLVGLVTWWIVRRVRARKAAAADAASAAASASASASASIGTSDAHPDGDGRGNGDGKAAGSAPSAPATDVAPGTRSEVASGVAPRSGSPDHDG